jgi:hypothetical protein
MAHHCHLPGCRVSTPPRFLMCPKHWAQVPADLQAAVYATVDKRHKVFCDNSWEPWWRAQARAVHAVQLATGISQEAADRRLADEMRFADDLLQDGPGEKTAPGS